MLKIHTCQFFFQIKPLLISFKFPNVIKIHINHNTLIRFHFSCDVQKHPFAAVLQNRFRPATLLKIDSNTGVSL